MRKLKIQSIADIITNSSSEIFVIKNPKGLSLSEDNYSGFLQDLEAYANLLLEFKHSQGCYESDDSISDWYETEIADEKNYDGFYNYGYDVGDLLVESSGDNSMPYELMEYVESSAINHGYSCKRTHLG